MRSLVVDDQMMTTKWSTWEHFVVSGREALKVQCSIATNVVYDGLDGDINHKQHHHALPGLVVLTDLQAKAKRPFACITAQQCQWIDMLVRLLMRQHGSL